jgi:hypothetical protein
MRAREESLVNSNVGLLPSGLASSMDCRLSRVSFAVLYVDISYVSRDKFETTWLMHEEFGLPQPLPMNATVWKYIH